MIPRSRWFGLLVCFGVAVGGVESLVETNDKSQRSLELVHVLFRHGDRTPDRKNVYPTDPYINETYYPWGYGELTKAGQRKEYLVGRALRRRYEKFLGVYTPPAVEARSTNFNRTKASLELVLAGLYPPTESEIFYGNLRWQPIPFQYGSKESDWLLGFPSEHCEAYLERYNEYVQSEDHQKKVKKHELLFEYLTERTGKSMNSTFDVSELYFTLWTELENGHKLPKWTSKVFPDLMLQATKDEYDSRTATDDMKRLTSGFLMKKILTDTKLKLSGKAYNARKIFLYSAHEYNLANMLHFLDIYNEAHVPAYGAYLLFEVHKVGTSYGFKILYQNYKSKRPVVMKLPNCEKICLVDKFMKLYGHLLPITDKDCILLKKKTV